MKLEPGLAGDIESATRCLAMAFTDDPLMPYFFPAAQEDRGNAVAEYFAFYFKARIAFAMPIWLARHAGSITGVVMGYDTRQLAWPADLQAAWQEFERRHGGSAERFHNYETVSERFKPDQPHYYLGALGVDPARRGKGDGLALVDTFCQLSESDPLSAGTYLETGNPHNQGFYKRCGFMPIGEHRLDAATKLYCLFRASGHHASV